MDIVKASGYEKPITLVYDGPYDMWDEIDRMKALMSQYANRYTGGEAEEILGRAVKDMRDKVVLLQKYMEK